MESIRAWAGGAQHLQPPFAVVRWYMSWQYLCKLHCFRCMAFFKKKGIPLQAWPFNVLNVKHVNILTDVREMAYMPAHVIKCFGGSGQNAEHIVESSNEYVYKQDLYKLTQT